MVKADQEVRKRWLKDQSNAAIMEEMKQLSTEHVARLREIIREHGWPTKTMVGGNGATGAWMIAQHGGPEMIAETLPLMEAAVKQGELDESLYGTTLDRSLIQQGKKQVYGTQFNTRDGKCEPLPIEDPEHVDERRARAGMTPLDQYTKQLCELYKQKP